MTTVEKILESKTAISSPLFDAQGNIYFCSPQTGDLLRLNIFGNTKGVPSAVSFDLAAQQAEGASKPQQLFICDFAHQAVLTLNMEDNQIAEFVREYEGKIFKGPNSLVFDSQGTLYFTDSGPVGETTIQKPNGSVFMISSISNGELLQPLALDCLANPCGIALSPGEDVVYVAETMNNRILRFIQKPAGVFHFSEFCKFSGRFGPTALAVDHQGNIYVALFEYREYCLDADAVGLIAVVNPQGEVIKRIQVPGPEITGLKFDNAKEYLYITESSTKSLYRVRI